MKKPLHKKELIKAEQAKADPISRRDFFNNAWKWLGILAAIEVLGIYVFG
jgi:aminoglycoside/choline kinase family phosphotransferase